MKIQKLMAVTILFISISQAALAVETFETLGTGKTTTGYCYDSNAESNARMKAESECLKRGYTAPGECMVFIEPVSSEGISELSGAFDYYGRPYVYNRLCTSKATARMEHTPQRGPYEKEIYVGDYGQMDATSIYAELSSTIDPSENVSFTLGNTYGDGSLVENIFHMVFNANIGEKIHNRNIILSKICVDDKHEEVLNSIKAIANQNFALGLKFSKGLFNGCGFGEIAVTGNIRIK